MTSYERKAIDAATTEAKKFGIQVTFQTKHTHRHSKLILKLGNKVGVITLCCTPRSRENQENWMRQEVRRFERLTGTPKQ